MQAQPSQSELVTIVITTHKGSDHIERAVQSVLDQDYVEKELIVVDDNGVGTDEQIATESALRPYVKKHQVIYHPHEVNRNGSVARNTGIQLSHGKYIGFLDDDDVFLPGKISKSISVLSRLPDEWGAVYTDVEIDYGKKGKYINRYHRQGNIVFELLAHTIFVNPSVMILRKAAIEKIGGFDESFKRHQDWEFNARLSDQFKIAHVDMIGSIYNCQIKRHYDRSAAKEYRSYYIEKMKPVISKLPRFKQEVIYYRNAIELCGFKIKNKKKCKELISEWGENAGALSFYYSYYLTALERLKVKTGRIK